ncbi:MAG: class I SAM-dependent methyltransferase [Firmicutes bacterium]|nr:class I SAM-dependent methyltransferase [Bacillota bacterium]
MSQKEWWNARFSDDKEIMRQGLQAATAKILTDKLWVENLPEFGQVAESAVGSRVIDLGCGYGQLSLFFEKLGACVTAVDFSENALAVLKSHSSNIKTKVLDITKPLPFDDEDFDIVIANLSLHYFSEFDTRNAITEAKRILKKDGFLVGSVVSTEEWEFVKHRGTFQEIEPNHYHEIFDSGRTKHIRFFSRDCINKFFGDFEFLYLENKFEQRMGKSKGAWEFIARRK